MALKTARTSLYLIDPEGATAGGVVLAVGCVTGVQGIGASREQMEDTCLEDEARSYQAGVATPGNATFSINFDPSDASHVRLYELWKLGTKLKWALGLSDGAPAPAALIEPGLNTAGDDYDLPDTRSWITFEGYITDVPLNLGLAAFVNADVSIQVSDFPNVFPKAP